MNIYTYIYNNVSKILRGITYITIITILQSQPSLAKTTNANTNAKQTIKFHKPETDAERALDLILKVENGLIKDSKLKHEDMFTKGFMNDCIRKQNEALNSKECKQECGDKPCGEPCYPFRKNCISCHNADPEFGYIFYTSYKDEKKAFISEMWSYEDVRSPENHGNVTKESTRFPYIMKKEDKIWKIDGLCCNGINCSTPANWDFDR